MPDLEVLLCTVTKMDGFDFGGMRRYKNRTTCCLLELALTSPPHLVLCQEGVSQVFLEEKLQPPRLGLELLQRLNLATKVCSRP